MIKTIGPVILDLQGPELTAEERDILQHPLVGGVILFSRNFENTTQLIQLCKHIRESRSTPLLLTVDQEGGRVQRFQNGFTRLPCMGDLGQLYETAPERAIRLTEYCGWLMAAELLAVGVDLSFAPVLDLNKKLNTVIGDRAFHTESSIVISLAKALIRGMNKAGMVATGKHFPGHGSVTMDSHLALPIDSRHFDTIAQDDLISFQALIRAGMTALMPAHILFSAVDNKSVCFSEKWLRHILRIQLQFNGVIISDDLSMAGAAVIGNHVERAYLALTAGCDMVLICNDRDNVIRVLDQLPSTLIVDFEKFRMLQGKFGHSYDQLQASREWFEATHFLSQSRRTHEFN